MKMRMGFVSNSSSTSFYFFTKGAGTTEIAKLLKRDHSEKFNLEFRSYGGRVAKCTVDDVCREIRWLHRKPKSINTLIREARGAVECYAEGSSMYNLAKDNYTLELFADYKKRNEEELAGLEQLKADGFTKVLEVVFADDAGPVDLAMDTRGGSIKIDDDDLKLVVKSNH